MAAQRSGGVGDPARPAPAGDGARILVVGVGGQGVLTIARLLGEAALAQGIAVRVGQLHGMAQRGGSVEASVVLGEGEGCFIGPGEADLLLGLEPLEALRALPRLAPGATVLLNTGRVVPFTLVMRGAAYPPPQEILRPLQEAAAAVHPLDAPALLEQLDAPGALNLLMLGALVGLGLLPLDEAEVWAAAERRLPARLREGNRAAFLSGREALRGR